MQRLILSLGICLALLLSACGSDDAIATGGERELPTPEPAPTLPGIEVEIELPAFDPEIVPIGFATQSAIEIRALPGSDQPIIGEVPAGADGLDLVGEVFETDDGAVWWMIRYETTQGWVRPRAAFLGIATDITEQATAAVASSGEFTSPEMLAEAIGQFVAEQEEAPDVVIVANSQTDGDLTAVVTVDLVGLEDDSIAGYRLLVSTRSTDGASWTHVSTVQSALCPRGLSPEGLCA